MKPHIRTMTAADVPLGMRLKQQAGWNQTETDWQRFLALGPGGCFVAEVDGEPVGTVAAWLFGGGGGDGESGGASGGIGWIGMMLVDEAHRSRGIGTALMRHALDYLDVCGARSVRLDATPLGRPLYEKLGFHAQFELARFQGEPALGAVEDHVEGCDPKEPGALEAVIELDRSATRTDRSALLRHLLNESANEAGACREGGELTGYWIGRPGSRATQVGPCIAATERAGRALLAEALRRYRGRSVFVDAPLDNGPAVELIESAGLSRGRPFIRMCRGEAVCEAVDQLWASSGPEKG